LFLAELSQGCLIVIGNDIEFDPVFPEFRVSIAQLAELRPAGRSPDNRADKNNNRPRLVAIGMQVDWPAMGIRQREAGQCLANFRACAVTGRQSGTRGMTQRHRCIKSVFISLHDHLAASASCF